MQRGSGRGSPAGAQSLLWRENDELCLELASRKNRQSGSGVIRRRCTCQGNKDICPIHVLWESFAVSATPGQRLWQGVTAGIARTRLRQLLSRLHVDNAMLHNTHDFRRGHARVRFAYTPYENAPISHFSCAGSLEIRRHISRDFDCWPMEERSLFEVFRRSRIGKSAPSFPMCYCTCPAMLCRRRLTR